MKLSPKMIRSGFNWILEILFPSFCLGCKKKGEILCSNCLIKIKRVEKETDNNITAVFDYHDPLIKKIIWNLKYYSHSYFGQKLGKILFEELLEDLSEIKSYITDSPILVIPVPLSKVKSKKRGYNQARKIAEGFCEEGGSKNFTLKNNIVIKKIETLPQARIINRKRRLKNISGAFEVKNPNLIKGKTIIIIDDVTTTGGTINEIITELKKAGAKKVVGFAVAH